MSGPTVQHHGRARYSRFQRMIASLRYFFVRYYYLSPLREALDHAKNRLLGASAVRLEASSICQLACPVCPTGTGAIRGSPVGWGYLSFGNFAAFVDSNPSIKKIELSNWGEIFLNPDLKKIIEYACQKNIALSAGNGVNLNTLSEDMAETLVRCRFRRLTVSIDGASSGTYAQYRKNGNFGRVLENIKKINKYKQMHRSRYPKLTWKFIVFGHNEHEIPAARKMAKGLGMRFFPQLNWSPTYSPIKDEEFVERETGFGVSTSRAYLRKTNPGTPFLSYCHQLWTSPQINWDGKLLGCCVNRTVSFGNVFEKGLDACTKDERYELMKKTVKGKAPVREDLPCFTCSHFPFAKN